jgi:hypothetical protein
MIHAPIELGQPGREKCPDKYNEASSLWCPGARRIMLQISKKKVFVQLGVMQQGRGAGLGSVQWQPEEPFLPVVASLGRKFDAVRVRNWGAGEEAEVFIATA